MPSSRPAQRRGLALTGVFALLAAGGLFLVRGDRDPAPARASAQAEVTGLSDGLVAAREPLEPAPVPQPGTARAFLAEYHGARWPELQAAMEKAKLPLDQPFVFQPWEEVELAIRGQARLDDKMRHRLENKDWVAPLTNEWLQKEYELPSDVVLDGAELAELEAELASEMLALQSADKAYADQLDFHLQAAFERREFVAAPFSTTGLDSEMGFFCKSVASGCWAASFVLRDEECPDLVELRQQIRQLEDERDRRVSVFLAARRAR